MDNAGAKKNSTKSATDLKSKNVCEGDPSKDYNCCFCTLLIFLGIFVLVVLLFIGIFWSFFIQYWYWWLLGIALIIAIAFGLCCLVRYMHVKKTAKRMELLETIAGDINRRYLAGVGSKIIVGDEGAWLGIEMDPRRTKIEGRAELDRGETSKLVVSNHEQR
jgi:hypothetical protein